MNLEQMLSDTGGIHRSAANDYTLNKTDKLATTSPPSQGKALKTSLNPQVWGPWDPRGWPWKGPVRVLRDGPLAKVEIIKDS